MHGIADDLSTTPTDELITWLGEAGLVPTREIEEFRSRGDIALAGVRMALRERIDEGEPDTSSAWYVLLLGLEGGPRDVGLLCDVLAASAPDDIMLRGMIADSLARIGAAALPDVTLRLQDAPEDQRLWLYASLGWIPDADARTLLRKALRSDAPLRDVTGTALGIHGSLEMPAEERDWIREELAGAIETAEDWQRPDVRDALREFEAGTPAETPQAEDWRLRYRMIPRFGQPLPNWAGIAAITRDDPELRASRARASADHDGDEDLSELDEPRCECCDEPMWESAGVLVCAMTAVSIPVLLSRWLGDARDELEGDDLFDVLDDVEANLYVAYRAKPRRSRQRAHEDRIAQDELLRQMTMWMIRDGTESISEARASLLAEALRNADLYGDPDGVLQRTSRGEPGARRGASAGRNDPCPCGSGRKYKKCCGAVG